MSELRSTSELTREQVEQCVHGIEGLLPGNVRGLLAHDAALRQRLAEMEGERAPLSAEDAEEMDRIILHLDYASDDDEQQAEQFIRSVFQRAAKVAALSHQNEELAHKNVQLEQELVQYNDYNEWKQQAKAQRERVTALKLERDKHFTKAQEFFDAMHDAKRDAEAQRERAEELAKSWQIACDLYDKQKERAERLEKALEAYATREELAMLIKAIRDSGQRYHRPAIKVEVLEQAQHALKP